MTDDVTIPEPELREADDLAAGILDDRRHLESAAYTIVSRTLSLGQRIARLQMKHPRAAYQLTCRVVDTATKSLVSALRPNLPAEDVDLYVVRDLFSEWMVEYFATERVRAFVSRHYAADRAELCGLLDPGFDTKKSVVRWMRGCIETNRIIELKESAQSGVWGFEWCPPDCRDMPVQFLRGDPHLKTLGAGSPGSYYGA